MFTPPKIRLRAALAQSEMKPVYRPVGDDAEYHPLHTSYQMPDDVTRPPLPIQGLSPSGDRVNTSRGQARGLSSPFHVTAQEIMRND